MLGTLVKTEQAGKGEFSPLGVLADPLARGRLAAPDVQQVVGDLKGQAEPLAVVVQGGQLLGVGPGDHRPQPQRDPDHGPGLAVVDGFEE